MKKETKIFWLFTVITVIVIVIINGIINNSIQEEKPTYNRSTERDRIISSKPMVRDSKSLPETKEPAPAPEKEAPLRKGAPLLN